MVDPIQGKPPLAISQGNLQKSDALRASMGLPPLEKETSVSVVSTQPKQVTRSDLAELQGKAANTVAGSNPKDNEAVSFLKVPFVGSKAQGTNMVPSTTLLDPLQFSGVGAGTKAAIKGGSILVDVLKSQAKPASKIGTKDIGLNIAASKTFQSTQRFERQTRTLPKPGSINTPYSSPPKAPKTTPSSIGFTGTNVNLGRGIGTMTKSGGKGGITNDLFKPPPSPPSPPKPSQGKEVSAGKGLIQLVKEKPITTQKSTFKQYPISLGKTEVKTVPKQTQLTKADQAMQKYLQSLQTMTLKRQTKQKQSQDSLFMPVQKQSGKQSFGQPQKQKQRQTPIILPIPRQTSKTLPTGKFVPTQKPTPVQKQPPLLKVPPLLFTPPRIPSPPPKTPSNPIIPAKIPSEPPTTKKKPIDFPFKIDPINGGGGSVFGGGSNKGYLGNVPEFSFTGMYNRSETIYTRGTPRVSKKELSPSNAFTKLSGQGRKQSKPLSNKFNRLI